MRSKAKVRNVKALAAALAALGPTRTPLTPIGGLPVSVSATAYRNAPTPALSGLAAYGSGLNARPAPTAKPTPVTAYSGPKPSVTPLATALSANAGVGGSGRGTANAALGGNGLPLPATATPLKASAVSYVTGSAANLARLYGPNLALTATGKEGVYYAYVANGLPATAAKGAKALPSAAYAPKSGPVTVRPI